MTEKEGQLIARGSGLWGDVKVPKQGWTCAEVFDIGEASEVCEMCQSKIIRYVHHMQHGQHTPLLVGRICAGHMMDDLAGATDRERQVRNASARKQRQAHAAREAAEIMEQMSQPQWLTSQNGNPYVKLADYMAVVYQNRRGGFGFGTAAKGAKMVFSPKRFPTQDAAKMDAWIALGKMANI